MRRDIKIPPQKEMMMMREGIQTKNNKNYNSVIPADAVIVSFHYSIDFRMKYSITLFLKGICFFTNFLLREEEDNNNKKKEKGPSSYVNSVDELL